MCRFPKKKRTLTLRGEHILIGVVRAEQMDNIKKMTFSHHGASKITPFNFTYV